MPSRSSCEPPWQCLLTVRPDMSEIWPNPDLDSAAEWTSSDFESIGPLAFRSQGGILISVEPDRRLCSRARLSRDARFDGRFYVAVLSTGIYCRPICRARTAKESNVRYFSTAAAAAEAGFRPCLRCRPECSPGTPAW